MVKKRVISDYTPYYLLAIVVIVALVAIITLVSPETIKLPVSNVGGKADYRKADYVELYDTDKVSIVTKTSGVSKSDLSLEAISTLQIHGFDKNNMKKVAIYAIVKNLGEEISSEYKVFYFIDGAKSSDGQLYEPLESGAKKNTVSFEKLLAPGQYTIYFLVVPIQPDSNILNNKISASLTIEED